MAEVKRYYWLKLKRDFFKRHDIRVIESMPNGKDYVLFYLKLMVESIDHEGSLRFSDTIPYNVDMLAAITNTNIDVVRSAMNIFTELQMIEILDDQTIFMNEVEKLIGSETNYAEKMRASRERKKQLEGNNVTPMLPERYPEKEIEEENREKRKEKEYSFYHSAEKAIEKSIDKALERAEAKRKYLGGSLGKGVVFLSDDQMNDLLEKLSIEEFDHYVSVVADCELSGKPFKKKTHYQAILDMAAKDRKTK